MSSRDASEHALAVSGATVERDMCINSVEALLKQRFLQLNAEHIVGVGTVQERSDLHGQLTTDIADLTAALLLWKKTATASAPVSRDASLPCLLHHFRLRRRLVSRLPPEVLQNMFAFLVILDPPITHCVSAR